MSIKAGRGTGAFGHDLDIVVYELSSRALDPLRTNNPWERLNLEIKCRTRVAGNFPNSEWARVRYLTMDRLSSEELVLETVTV